MARAVRIERLGSIDGLEVRTIPRPDAGAGEVRVRVLAAGLNPVDWKIVEYRQTWDAYASGLELPVGNGSDLAGVVEAVGPGVIEWAVGDEVFGGRRFHAQADFAIVAAGDLLRRPSELSWEQAGGLAIVGRTAVASLRAVGAVRGETVLVGGASGGVGMLVSQLARRAGAHVIGTASERNHTFLRELGVQPVGYGPGLVDAVRALAPNGVAAVLDNHGHGAAEVGLALGAVPERVNTIADRAFAASAGVRAVGGAEATQLDLAEVAELIASGAVRFDIDSVYPLERVREAYERLKRGTARGKVVLVTE